MLASVIKHINKAKQEEDKATMIYLDKQGEIDVAQVKVYGPDDEEWSLHLNEAAARPSFEICTVFSDGRVMAISEFLDNGDNETLKKAIDNAVGERKRYFKERSKEAELWPVTA